MLGLRFDGLVTASYRNINVTQALNDWVVDVSVYLRVVDLQLDHLSYM